jgi:serine/threonine protein kinase
MIIEANGTSYECSGRTGKGSFGVVYKAVERDTGKVVAIKRVLQDPRYKVLFGSSRQRFCVLDLYLQ